MKAYRAYYETFGCQMNVFDIEFIESLMTEAGFETTASPEDADAIVVNTCSVRGHAEQRAIGRMADLSRHSGAVLVAVGCMAQRLGTALYDLVPGLAVVAGTDEYRALPRTIRNVLAGGGRISLLTARPEVGYPLGSPRGKRAASRYLAVSRGCENYCSYCIVPYLRGPVRHRDASRIIAEIRSLAEGGCREVTLIGQNVMAYRGDGEDFTGLLRRVAAGTDIARIRFLTTHPRDVNSRLFELMASEPRICPHIHLPLQAGSDRILRLMNRGYGRDDYIRIIEEGRRFVPHLAVSTDIIVGFPTESDLDFSETMAVVETVRFDAAFTFKYSPRPGTPAASMEDDVPAPVKRERLRSLNECIARIRREILLSHLHERAEILLDGMVRKREYDLWKGRTPHFRNVLVRDIDARVGDIITVELAELRNYTFIGEPPVRR